jgi:hypothetical protein
LHNQPVGVQKSAFILLSRLKKREALEIILNTLHFANIELQNRMWHYLDIKIFIYLHPWQQTYWMNEIRTIFSMNEEDYIEMSKSVHNLDEKNIISANRLEKLKEFLELIKPL